MTTISRLATSALCAVGLVAAARIPEARPQEVLGTLPPHFEPNAGQGGPEVKFLSRGKGYRLLLTADGAMLASDSLAVRMRFAGAGATARLQGEEPLPGQSHYLLGNDPAKWRRHVPHFARVRHRELYPGIDVVYYWREQRLEYDFELAAGADPARIRLQFEGGQQPVVDAGGDLVLGALRLHKPTVYQQVQGRRRILAGRYRVTAGGNVGFVVPAHDRTRPLVIDPVLSIATMLGGGSDDYGRAIAVDASGAIYITGSTPSGNFPIANAFQPLAASVNGSVFVTKLNSDGTALVYSTYLGEGSGGGIAVDAAGNAHITGFTSSPDFPQAGSSPLQTTFGTGFAAKLSADGSTLIYSTFIGFGSDFVAGRFIGGTLIALGGTGIAVDGEDNAYITGSTSLKSLVVLNALQSTLAGGRDGYVVKLRADGTPVYSTYLGGTGNDAPSGIAVDGSGAAYVTGSTDSADFPVRNAVQGSLAGGSDAFLAKLSSDGSRLVYSTYLGGIGKDASAAIALDAAGAAYVTGTTNSGDFPIFGVPAQPKLASGFAFKSTDGANTWTRSDTGLGALPEILLIDPVNTSNVYAVAGGVLYKSSDGGTSWRYMGVKEITALAINPVDSSTLFAATGASPPLFSLRGAILRSTDGGATFKTVLSAVGYVGQFAIDPKDPSVIYAASCCSREFDGLWKSDDGGDTWRAPGLRGPGQGITTVAVDPARPSTVYASHGAFCSESCHENFLRKSVDEGETFINLPTGAPFKLLVDPAGSTLYILDDFFTGRRILRSIDGGQSFSNLGPIPASAFGVYALAIDPAHASTLYAGTFNGGVFKTTDGGNNWQQLNRGFTNLRVLSLAIDPKDAATLYAGAAVNPDAFITKLNPEGGLEYSTYLGGRSVESASGIAVDALGNAYVTGATDSSDFPVRNAFRLAGAGYVAKLDRTGSLVWSSLLGGATPLGIATGAGSGIYLTGSSFDTEFPLQNAFQPSATGTAFRSTDGGAHWTGDFAETITYLAVEGLAIDPKTPSRIFASTRLRLLLSTDSGATWNRTGFTGDPSAPPVIDPQNPSTLYLASASPSGVLKSTDGGGTWVRWGIDPRTTANALAIDPKNPSTLYAGTAAGVYKSTDAGGSWAPIGRLPNAQALTLDPINPSILYGFVAGNNGGVFRSADAGATWSPANSGIRTGALTRILLADPATPGLVYAAGTAGVYRSVNGGGSWSSIGGGLPSGPFQEVLSLALDPSDPSILYAGSASGGLYQSADRGASWTLTPLKVPRVRAIAVDPTNRSLLYVGTDPNILDGFVAKVVE